MSQSHKESTIAVVGLGYVGLPLAIALSRHHASVIGFDIDEARVASLKAASDHTNEVDRETLRDCGVTFTGAVADIEPATVYILTVPTPIDRQKRPDLEPILSATELVGSVLKPGDLIVYESTVYPGLTEEICVPSLEAASGLKYRKDFSVGYSPERINPGDSQHTLAKVIKIISGDSEKTLERLAGLYAPVASAGLYHASSIKVAEAAKVIENTQRDINIALVNELALICGKLGIRTQEVLEAAGTKWNFMKFSPGLVGGHCIGVDPYYLTAKAEAVGYRPEIILAGRRINDGMGAYVANQTVKMISAAGGTIKGSRVGILGVTFKENVRDLRNSGAISVIAELNAWQCQCLIHDPIASEESALKDHGLELSAFDAMTDLDALVVAVPHDCYRDISADRLIECLKPAGVFIDVRSIYINSTAADLGDRYWCL